MSKSSVILLYHTTTSSSAPALGDLVAGELALNNADGILYYLNTGSNTIQAINSATAAKATNLAGGATGSVPYQSAANATTFLAAGTDGQAIVQAGGVPTYANIVNSVAGDTGTATGLTLTPSGSTGAVTLTLGGTLNVANGGTGATTLTGYVKGSGTSALTAAATIPFSDISGTVSVTNALTVGTGLQLDTGTTFNGSAARTISIANTVTAGSVGSSTAIPVLTYNAQGQITNVTTAALTSPSYQGVWNAATNTPALASGVGVNQEYYIVSVAGNTNLDGISDWQVGDWAIFSADLNAWQQVNGSNSESFTNITVTGLTGYMYANGSSQVSAATSIPFSDVTGTVPAGQGGTGVSNSYTITVNNANQVLDQSVASGATPTFTATNFSGTAASLNIGGNAATATKSTNINGGAANEVPYQTAANTTSFVTAPTVAGQVLTYSAGSLTWAAPSGTVANAVTFNSSGSGDVSPQSFDGSSAITVSYNTIGASPLAGSTSLTTLGTITTGVWNGTAIANANLANSQITFGSTAQALGSTVSTIDGVTIGGSTPAAVTGTTITATTYVGISGGTF